MYTRLNLRVFVWMVIVILAAQSAQAANCTTSSGTSCNMSCAVGTLSLSCSADSKICSGSCSDSTGNMDIFLANLVKDIAIASDGKLEPIQVVKYLKQDFDLNQLQNNDGRTQIGSRTYTIRIEGEDLSKWVFSGDEYQSVLSRVENVVRNLNLKDMQKGDHIRDLRR